MGNQTGVIKQGVSTEIVCDQCGQKRIEKVGTVTEKGVTPVQATCQPCLWKHLEHTFKEK